MEKCRHNVHRLYGVLAYTSRFTWDKTATCILFLLTSAELYCYKCNNIYSSLTWLNHIATVNSDTVM